MTTEARLPTRQLVQPDVPRFDVSELADTTRGALAELLLTMADDEFVLGFWDSEWTGIGPMLEEDVAFSSIAQDELGHARIWYEMAAQISGDSADRLAFGRQPDEFRHAALVDHPRTDWSFSIARRWMYDTADSIRLASLAESSFRPLADVVAKVRREERYHLLHMDLWLRRLAGGGDESRGRLAAALNTLRPDAHSVFTPLGGEDELLRAGILTQPMERLAERWAEQAGRVLIDELGFGFSGDGDHSGNRDHHPPSESFRWLWSEFTSVARLEEGVEW
ncbi:MAG TPA: 1,2-phenylacetyl-CoA epoxidase subunit PaaC [Candidatus Limnocylindria bacterium]|nr:1,2-phenylacetyl-CoA epoxidase subunit PaaC [Candidatus Limnocylindria bacterium]